MFEIHADETTAKKKLLPLASIARLQAAEDTAQRMGKKARKVPVIVYVPLVVV